MKLTIVIGRTEHGALIGYVPSLDGCFATGFDLHEIKINMKHSFESFLEPDPASIHVPAGGSVEIIEI